METEQVVKLNNHALKIKLYFKLSIRCNTRSGKGMSQVMLIHYMIRIDNVCTQFLNQTGLGEVAL
ncbi:MAG: hypothetical protein RLZZ540_1250 [Bacteroidota bacterium]|jgi:hypothetical protein